MPMNPRLLVPRANFDSDAAAYIRAVEVADTQPLEAGVKRAIDNFVRGCKLDGTWSAIKASCILAGARTLSGALVPLKGSAPTNTNFVSADYTRKDGLKGNGTDKVLNTNRNNNSDPQDSKHVSLWITEATTVFSFGRMMAAGDSTSADTYMVTANSGIGTYGVVVNNSTNSNVTQTSTTGFFGLNRSLSSEFIFRQETSETTVSRASGTPRNENIHFFGRPGESPLRYTNPRIAFYSIGESLNMGLLRSRLSTLIAAFASL